MDNVLVTVNFEKICRICLTECDENYSIFNKYRSEEDGETLFIYQILLSISDIKIRNDDGLPSNICFKCKENAQKSYKFQKQCNKSQALFDSYLAQVNNTEFISVINNTPVNETSIDTELKNDGLLNDDSVLSEHADVTDFGYDLKNSVLKNEEDDEHMKMVDTSLILPTNRIVNINKDNTIACNDNDNEDLQQKTVGKKGTLMNYYSRFLPNGEKIFQCNICKNDFKHGNSLRLHLKTIHPLERPYICNTCNKGFTKYRSLVFHQKSHTGERPYSCKICGKQYKQSGSLNAHMRVHTGVRPFLCSICGRRFRQAPDLNYHMRTHTKEKPYMCNICGKTMSMQCHLVQHLRSHTGERPFKCMECNKAFPSSTRLKRHSIIHTDLKPFTCDVCNKSFNRNSSLRVHSKIHTDERSHVCHICDKRFIQLHALKTHLMTHSNNSSKLENVF